MNYVTTREVVASCRGVNYTVPKGTRVTNITADGEATDGVYFVDDFKFIDGENGTQYRPRIHDPYFHGIRIHPTDVRKVEDGVVPEENFEPLHFEYDMTHVAEVPASKRAQGIEAYIFLGQKKLEIFRLPARREFLNPTQVWYMTPSQAKAFQNKLDIIKSIREKRAQEELILLSMLGINKPQK